jgi:hypothetical protein
MSTTRTSCRNLCTFSRSFAELLGQNVSVLFDNVAVRNIEHNIGSGVVVNVAMWLGGPITDTLQLNARSELRLDFKMYMWLGGPITNARYLTEPH